MCSKCVENKKIIKELIEEVEILKKESEEIRAGLKGSFFL